MHVFPDFLRKCDDAERRQFDESWESDFMKHMTETTRTSCGIYLSQVRIMINNWLIKITSQIHQQRADKAEKDRALQEQEMKLRAEHNKREGILIDKLGERKCKKRSKMTGRKGPKTKFMEKQLRVFSRFVTEHKYKDDTRTLYALANQCWLANKEKWNNAKSAEGQKKGYSSAKIMADAYKKTN